jgi:hypothetical protein
MAANLLYGWCIGVMDLMRAAEAWDKSKPGSIALGLIQARKRNGSLVVTGSPRCSIKDLPSELLDLIDSHLIREVALDVDKWPSCSCCREEHYRALAMCDDCQHRCDKRCTPIGFCNCLTKKRVIDCSDCIDARFESHFNCEACWDIMLEVQNGKVSCFWLDCFHWPSVLQQPKEVSDFLAYAGLVQTMDSLAGGGLVALIGRPLRLLSRNQNSGPAGLGFASAPLAVSSDVNTLTAISVDQSSALTINNEEKHAFGATSLDQELFSAFSTDDEARLLRLGRTYGLQQDKAFSSKIVARNFQSGKRQIQQLSGRDYQPAWIMALLCQN